MRLRAEEYEVEQSINLVTFDNKEVVLAIFLCALILGMVFGICEIIFWSFLLIRWCVGIFLGLVVVIVLGLLFPHSNYLLSYTGHIVNLVLTIEKVNQLDKNNKNLKNSSLISKLFIMSYLSPFCIFFC